MESEHDLGLLSMALSKLIAVRQYGTVLGTTPSQNSLVEGQLMVILGPVASKIGLFIHAHRPKSADNSKRDQHVRLPSHKHIPPNVNIYNHTHQKYTSYLKFNMQTSSMTSATQQSTPQASSTTTDVDIIYAFLYSACTGEEPKDYEEGNHIHITSSDSPPLADGRVPCTAEFHWRDFSGNFECNFHPATGALTDFVVVEGSMGGGMEDVKEVEIEMCDEDDNENAFLVVRMEFGYSACGLEEGQTYGKKVLEGEELGQEWDLGWDERERLGLELEDEAEDEDEDDGEDNDY
jgi:hypothetical protein